MSNELLALLAVGAELVARVTARAIDEPDPPHRPRRIEYDTVRVRWDGSSRYFYH